MGNFYKNKVTRSEWEQPTGTQAKVLVFKKVENLKWKTKRQKVDPKAKESNT